MSKDEIWFLKSSLTNVFMSLYPVMQVFVHFKAGPINFNGTANDGKTQSQGNVMCDWASVIRRVGVEHLQIIQQCSNFRVLVVLFLLFNSIYLMLPVH